MRDAHITVAILKQVLSQSISPSELVRRIATHLCSVCPECEAALEQFTALTEDMASVPEGEPASSGVAACALPGIEEQPTKLRPHVQAEQERARKKGEALARLPDDVARAGIEEGEYRGAALAEELLIYVHRCLPGRPQDALRFAGLALLVLDHAPESPHAIDVRVRATAHVGNVVRIRGGLQAGHIVETARWIMNHADLANPLTAAEVDWIEGTLRRHQRRFDEALPLLQRAAIAYQKYGAPLDSYRVALSLALVYQDMGDYQRAAEIPLVVMAADVPPYLRIAAAQNVALAWADAGHTEQAAALIEEAEEILVQADPLTRTRSSWIKGRIAKGLKDWDAAEFHLRAAAHGMRRLEKPYDVALIHLDLSAVFLAAGRSNEVRQLAEELVAVFDGFGVHREAITALALYRDAVALDQVSESEISELAAYLRAAAVDPGLAWRAPA